jgi:hypothetical protein
MAMKKFLIKLSIASGIALLLHLVAGFFASGKTDAYYLRFTGKAQKSLIIGTSRAAQGMVPSQFDQYQKEIGYEGPMYNFAFTSITSPFGEVYYDKILQKLDPTTKNGLFIVTVEPYSICIPLRDSSAVVRKLPETTGALYNTHFTNVTPNFEYLLHNYSNGWGHLFLEHYNLTKTEMVLQENGWLEVNVPMDSLSIAKRSKGKIQNHKKSVGEYVYSPMRVEYLEKTIALLKQHGKVYIVRLPISKAIYDIEKEILPEFEDAILRTAVKMNVPYNDMNNARDLYQYKDGHHIGRASAFDCSDSVARWVRGLSR